MFSQVEAIGGCVESVEVGCYFGRDLDGSVVYEQWSVWVTPNAEADPWCQDAASYADAARIARDLKSYGHPDLRLVGPFPVTYTELGSLVEPGSVPPEGLTFRTHQGAMRVYAEAE